MKEINCELSNGFILSGIQCGKGQKILCLHGWLDNCYSFKPLMNLLDGFEVTSLDLPGHGKSSWLAKDLAGYSITQGSLKVIEYIKKNYEEPITLMSHSLGAGMSSLIAAICPELISKIILIDNLAPLPEMGGLLVQRLQSLVKGRSVKARFYESIDKAIDARMRSGVSFEIASLFAERSVIRKGDGYIWKYDSRLQSPSISKFSISQVHEIVSAIECEVLFMEGRWDFHGFKDNLKAKILPAFKKIKTIEFDTDSHYFHIEDKARVRDCVIKFLS